MKQIPEKSSISKPYFVKVTSKEYGAPCWVYKKGTIREIRWRGPNKYYTTIQATSQVFSTLGEAIDANYNYN